MDNDVMMPTSKERQRNQIIWPTVALLAGVVFGVLFWPHAVRASVFNPDSFQLENGIQVVVVPQPRQVAVTHMVWYRVGAMDEPQYLTGIAHFLEHLMFKATETRPAGQFAELVGRSGGRQNAFTSSDYTAYFQTVAKNQLPLMMELEADRMRNLVINADEVSAERQVILEERHQRVDNNPQSLLYEQLDAVQFLTHPYRNPIIGWEHDIRAIDVDDLERFYARYYVPSNAVVIVAGNVSVDEIRPLAERTYGALASTEVEPRADPVEAPSRASRDLVLEDPRVAQPVWVRSYLAPSYLQGDTRHAYALQVLAHIVGDGPTSRLYRRLVVDEEAAVNAQASYDPSRRGPSQFIIHASPRPGVPLERIQALIDAETAAILSGAITEEEVAQARTRLRANAVYARDSLFAGAMAVGETVALGLPVEHVEGWPDAIAAVTTNQVMEAARHVLERPRSVTAFLPAETVPETAIR